MKGLALTVSLWLCIAAWPAASVFAQAAAPQRTTSPPAAATSEATPPPAATPDAAAPVDPNKLPVSLGRIRLQLAIKSQTKTSGLKIQETIEVVGVAPKFELWNPETAKLATGPVPWGAPTHRDFIDLVTPQEFKNYPMDINAVVQWLLQHLGDKTDKTEKKPTE